LTCAPRHHTNAELCSRRRSVGLTGKVALMTETHATDASQIARLAVHVRWAACEDRTAATAAARAAFAARFEREVDPEGKLPPAERARRAQLAKSAFYRRLALKSAQVRRARAAAKRSEGGAAE